MDYLILHYFIGRWGSEIVGDKNVFDIKKNIK